MGVTIIVGGQYGSEGKGKTALAFSRMKNAAAIVRVGGPNSGHTVIDKDGKKHVFRMLPSAAVDNGPDAPALIFPAGSYLDIKILLDEMEENGIEESRVLIDPNACIIRKAEKDYEVKGDLRKNIASTLSGTGGGVAARIARRDADILAKNHNELENMLCDTKKWMDNVIKAGRNIIVEGTQGYMLSSIHTPCYPYCTSRDTTAAGFLSECGLSPFDVDDVVMCLRTYPIRVGGNSGYLPREISWDKVSKWNPHMEPVVEYTSVTHTVRRVAEFDHLTVKEAILANKPTHIVLNHLDYISPDARKEYVYRIQDRVGCEIDYLGLGPENIFYKYDVWNDLHNM